jgi:hypothetical protein
MLHRSGKTRARISEKTIKYISFRERLKGAFVDEIGARLADLGVAIVDLDRGGFSLIAVSALDGAPSILAKNYIGPEMKSLNEFKLNLAEVRQELGIKRPDDE